MKLLWLLFPYLISSGSQLCAQQWSWGRQSVNTTTAQYPLSIGHDSSGNCYVMGRNLGSAVFGTVTVAAGNFVVKYNSLGFIQWVVNLPSQMEKLAVERNGNFLVAGNFSASISAGAQTLQSNGQNDLCVLKYNSSGTLQWGRTYGDTLNDYVSDIEVDTYGDAYITGGFSGKITFGNTLLADTLPSHFFLAQINPAGQVNWATSGEVAYYAGKHLYINKNGTLFVQGEYLDTCSGCTGFFHDRYTASGNRTFVGKLSSHMYSCEDFTVDDSLNIYHISGGSQYGDKYLTRFNSLYQYQWSRIIAEGYGSYFLSSGICSDKNGNIYLGGSMGSFYSYADSVEFQSNWYNVNAPADLCVASFNNGGKLTKATFAAGTNGEYITAMTRNDNGELFAAGLFHLQHNNYSKPYDSLWIGPDLLVNDGSWPQMFVAKLDPSSLSTGLRNENDDSFAVVFPNPTNQLITINYKAPDQNKIIRLFDYMGHCVLIDKTTSFSVVLDLKYFPRGVYLLEIASEHSVKTTRLILE